MNRASLLHWNGLKQLFEQQSDRGPAAGGAVVFEFTLAPLDAVEHGGNEGALDILGEDGLVLFEKGDGAGELHQGEGAAVADCRVEFAVLADRVTEPDDVVVEGVRSGNPAAGSAISTSATGTSRAIRLARWLGHR